MVLRRVTGYCRKRRFDLQRGWQGLTPEDPVTLEPIPGGGQFAIMRVTDTGEMIEVEWAGHNYLDNQLLGLRFNVGPDGISNRTVLE